MNKFESDNIRNVINEGTSVAKSHAPLIVLNKLSVLKGKQFRNIISESKNENEKGAIENPIEKADGVEMFARLSAFENDRRVDKINKCLRPGSYTTTLDDYIFL